MFNFIKKAATATETTIEISISEKQSFKDIRPQWKILAQERKITSEDIAALCIYRAMIKGQVPELAIAKLNKAYNPITNATKLANGAEPMYARQIAINSVKYSNLAKWLSPDELKALVAAAETTRVALK